MLWYADCDEDGAVAMGAESEWGCDGGEPPNAPMCGGKWTQTAPVAGATDCDDMRADVKPGATEICDTRDNDCDGAADEDGLTTFYRDSDMDGHGDPTMSMEGCGTLTGYVVSNDDCNDTRNDIYPGRVEACDSADNNCNNMIDEGVKTTYYADADQDGHGNLNMTMAACTMPSGYVTSFDDCDDANNIKYPGRPEVCDGFDNDCDSVVDDGVQTNFYADADNDLHGNVNVATMACTKPNGYVTSFDDCDDSNALRHPQYAEVCDAIDNDCDNVPDDGVQTTLYRDADGDSFGTPSMSMPGCATMVPSGYSLNNQDCRDDLPLVKPGAEELCFDSLDNNCSGAQDENATCSIGCNWSGAKWLSHGWDGQDSVFNHNAFLAGAWVSCQNSQITYIKREVFNPPNTSGFAAIHTPKGKTDNVVGCNWGATTRWANQGYDDARQATNGVQLSCDGTRVTQLNWGTDQVFPGQIPKLITAGKLGCDWTDVLYLSHGLPEAPSLCAWYTGIAVTCHDSHITNIEWVQPTSGCTPTRN